MPEQVQAHSKVILPVNFVELFPLVCDFKVEAFNELLSDIHKPVSVTVKCKQTLNVTPNIACKTSFKHVGLPKPKWKPCFKGPYNYFQKLLRFSSRQNR